MFLYCSPAVFTLPKPEPGPALETTSARDLRDLGFGARVLEGKNTRFLNRDGTFNVVRLGLPWWRSLNPYHTLVTCSWWAFYGLLAAVYLAINLLFALGYLACGPEALAGATSITLLDRFFDAFFFSVQTLATIGYGALSPHGLPANILVAIEALLGLLGVALATGLSFARFARPQARIRFAERAVIAPYGGGWGLMFRLANERSSQLLEVRATVVLSHLVEDASGRKERAFVPLKLERDKVVFFPLHWTVVHPIAEGSPLVNVDAASLARSETEIFILMAAFDEASSQSVHARTSYRSEEIVVGARYNDIFVTKLGKPTIDMSVLSAVTPV